MLHILYCFKGFPLTPFQIPILDLDLPMDHHFMLFLTLTIMCLIITLEIECLCSLQPRILYIINMVNYCKSIKMNE